MNPFNSWNIKSPDNFVGAFLTIESLVINNQDSEPDFHSHQLQLQE